jgi:hypothetical protein
MLTALVSALAIVAFAAPSAGAAGSTVWVAKPMCAAATPGHRSCLGMRLVRERATGAEQGGVRAGSARPALSDGPAGGYTPAQLAKAYGVNVGAAAASTQTVAIVDAFDDPSVKPDLAAFDTFYGIAAETPSSFRVVNQAGVAGPLPAPDAGWAGEITLDVQAVRGLCRRCKILLVEADSSSNDDLAAAVDEAVTLGAKEVSNSYGGPETDGNTAMVRASYNHHGVAITASTGDDGWYGWDRFNEGVPSDEVPSAPASFNTVVGVGGTSLYLNPNATRAGEQVWNTNGPSDIWGSNFGAALGAAGSGCSTLFAPQRWQRFVAGYGTLGCGSSLRSGVDIAADADPFTGFDVFQTYPNQKALYAAYTAKVTELNTNKFRQNFNDCGSQDTFGEVGWNHLFQHTRKYTVDQMTMGMVRDDQAAGRVFCNYTQGLEYMVWTQNDGHLMGYVAGPVHTDVWDWWVAVHHNIGIGGSPMNMNVPTPSTSGNGASASMSPSPSMSGMSASPSASMGGM